MVTQGWHVDRAAEERFARRAGLTLGRPDRDPLTPWHRWAGHALAALFLCLFTGLAVDAFDDAAAFRQHGVQTTGEVVRVDGWGKHRDYDVRFSLQDGQTVVREADDRAGSRRGGLEVGDRIQLTYDATDPGRVERHPGRLTGVAWFSVAFAGSALPAALVWDTYYRRHRRTERGLD